jgi:hypothetical protein
LAVSLEADVGPIDAPLLKLAAPVTEIAAGALV